MKQCSNRCEDVAFGYFFFNKKLKKKPEVVCGLGNESFQICTFEVVTYNPDMKPRIFFLAVS